MSCIVCRVTSELINSGTDENRINFPVGHYRYGSTSCQRIRSGYEKSFESFSHIWWKKIADGVFSLCFCLLWQLLFWQQ